MSTATASAVVVPNAPEGIVRIFVPTGLEVSKTDLRNMAAKAAGTINVGRVPAGKPAKLAGVTGHGYDFAPVARTTAAAKAAAAAPAAEDPRVAVLVGLGMTAEQASAVLGIVGDGKGVTGSGVASAVSSATADRTAAKADREVPAFLRKWESVTCRTCRDFGKVRGPGAGEKAGRPFRTQHGADSAPTAVPCPTHTAAGKASGRKGHAKA